MGYLTQKSSSSQMCSGRQYERFLLIVAATSRLFCDKWGGVEQPGCYAARRDSGSVINSKVLDMYRTKVYTDGSGNLWPEQCPVNAGFENESLMALTFFQSFVHLCIHAVSSFPSGL